MKLPKGFGKPPKSVVLLDFDQTDFPKKKIQ